LTHLFPFLIMKFEIKQEKFEGPLDLLLELIGREKLSISEISLARVTEEYMQYLKALGEIDPEALAEFLVVASELLLIKSRSLLPSLQLTREEETSIEELERRLAEYQEIRNLARTLKNMETRRATILSREGWHGMKVFFYPPSGLTLEKLKSVFIAILESLPQAEKLAEDKIRRIISLEEKMKQMKEMLQGVIERAFSEMVRGAKDKLEVIVSFLAMLELASQKLLDVRQEKPFEDIVVRRVPR